MNSWFKKIAMSIITLFVIIATIMVFQEENQNYGKEINNQAYSAQFLLNADGKIEGTPQRLNQVSNPPVAKQVNIFEEIGETILGWPTRSNRTARNTNSEILTLLKTGL